MVTIRLITPSFQLIYAWGMFLSITLEELLRFYVSIHICAGNVLCDACIRHFSSYDFNSYIREECFKRFLQVLIHTCAGNVSGKT